MCTCDCDGPRYVQAEGLLKSNGVDLVINAHEHNMEATYPVFNGTVTSTDYKQPAGTGVVCCIVVAVDAPDAPDALAAVAAPAVAVPPAVAVADVVVVVFVSTGRLYLLPACFPAPVYVVNGAGGNREGNDMPDGAVWTAFRSKDVGFALITVTGSQSLLYEFVAANGTTVWEFEITK